jgi:hypothetical protein
VTVVFTASAGIARATIASASVAPSPLPLRVRVAAWVVTGPLGHLWGGVCDWAELLVRYGWARVRGREVRWLE